MSRIRSKWNALETVIHNQLKSHKIRHTMHPKILGSPDILLLDSEVAVFLHGCFWHMCQKCYKDPKTRIGYWLPKLRNNVKRDRRNTRLLKLSGYRVLTIWEHEVRKDSKKVLSKIARVSSRQWRRI